MYFRVTGHTARSAIKRRKKSGEALRTDSLKRWSRFRGRSGSLMMSGTYRLFVFDVGRYVRDGVDEPLVLRSAAAVTIVESTVV